MDTITCIPSSPASADLRGRRIADVDDWGRWLGSTSLDGLDTHWFVVLHLGLGVGQGEGDEEQANTQQEGPCFKHGVLELA